MDATEAQPKIEQEIPLKEEAVQAEQTSKSRPNSAFVQSLKNQVSSLQTIFKKKQPNPEHLEEQDEAPKEEIVKVEPKTVQEPMGKAYSLFDLRFFTFGRKKKASNEPVALPETVAPVATTETVTEKVEAVVEEAAENKEAVTQAPPKKSLDFKRFISLGRSKKPSDKTEKGFSFSLFPTKKADPEPQVVVDEVEAEVVAAEKKASEESHVELPVVVEEVEATVKIDEAKADVPVEVEVVKVESEVLVSAVVEETKDEPNTILPAEAKEDVKPKVPEKVDEAPVEGSEIVETPDEVVKIAENIVEESACVKEKENSDTTAPKAKSSLFSFFKKAEKSTVEDAPADVPASIVSKVEATDNVPVEQNSDVVKPKSSRKTKFSFNPFKILNAQKPDVPPKESEVEVVESIADVPAESKAQDVTPVDEEIAVAETKVEPAAITEEVVAEVVSTLEENPAVVSDSQEIKMKAAENSEETIAPQTTEQ